MAAIYKIINAIRLQRPTQAVYYCDVHCVMRTHDLESWRSWYGLLGVNRMINDPERFNFGTTLENLETFRMPTGKKDMAWLSRVESAVGPEISLNIAHAQHEVNWLVVLLDHRHALTFERSGDGFTMGKSSRTINIGKRWSVRARGIARQNHKPTDFPGLVIVHIIIFFSKR